MTRLQSSAASGAERTRRTAGGEVLEPAGELRRGPRREVGERDRASVVARRRLELTRSRGAARRSSRSTSRRARDRPPRRGAPRCAPRAPSACVAEHLLERLPRRRVHLARGLGGQRVDDDLGTIGDAEAAARSGPVCTTNSRSLSAATRPLERRHRLAEHAARERRRRSDRPARRPPAASRDLRRREARDARRDEPAQRLRQREVLPHELHRDDAPIARPSPRRRRRGP